MQAFSTWLAKGALSKRRRKERFKELFFARREHRWISSDKYIRRCFNELIDLLGLDVIASLTRLEVCFIPGDRVLACTISPKGKSDLVVVYPDLIKSMRSAAPMHAVAVLAHEVGHVIHRHSERDLGALRAQLEADDFVVGIGLGHELYDVLLDHQDAPFCDKRLDALEKKISPGDS